MRIWIFRVKTNKIHRIASILVDCRRCVTFLSRLGHRHYCTVLPHTELQLRRKNHRECLLIAQRQAQQSVIHPSTHGPRTRDTSVFRYCAAFKGYCFCWCETHDAGSNQPKKSWRRGIQVEEARHDLIRKRKHWSGPFLPFCFGQSAASSSRFLHKEVKIVVVEEPTRVQALTEARATEDNLAELRKLNMNCRKPFGSLTFRFLKYNQVQAVS